MIISVSRRTDIPAFYSKWFMKRIEEGYFYRVNPYNPKQVKRFSLLPKDVDVIVFWTKNSKNILHYLKKLDKKGYNYIFQYTLNDYPKIFEPNLSNIEKRIDTFISLSSNIGKEKVIWRYDPIIISDLTPIEYHLEKFKKLSKRLADYTDRVIISFVDFYGKVENRFKRLQMANDINIRDMTFYPYRDELISFAKELKKIAENSKLKISKCCGKIDLSLAGIEQSKCIDIELFNKIFDLNLIYKKDKNQREKCLCTESIDLGMYNSCLHGCVYCYANGSEKVVLENHRKHCVNSSILIGEFDDGGVGDGKGCEEQLKFDV